MVKVIIEQSELTSSQELKEILIDRLAEVMFTTDDNNKLTSYYNQIDMNWNF